MTHNYKNSPTCKRSSLRDKILGRCLPKVGKGFSYILCLYIVFVTPKSFSATYDIYQDEKITVTGTVFDELGQPMIGVTVVEDGTANGTQTDFDGVYTISAAPQEILVFTFVGFQSEERLLGANTSILNITLEESTESLDEVVVVGYGVQRKRDVTGAISQVKGDEIADLVTPSFESQLSGRAAGVQITTQNGIVGEAPRFRIRGIAVKNTPPYKNTPPCYNGLENKGGYS